MNYKRSEIVRAQTSNNYLENVPNVVELSLHISEQNYCDEILGLFLNGMVSELVHKYGDEIVTFALFGSATTKEWIKGKSDINFMVVVKHQEIKRRIIEYIDKTILGESSKPPLDIINLLDECVRDGIIV